MRTPPQPVRTTRAAPHGEPPLQAVSTLVTGRRYLLLSVLATAIAVASTYQRLLALSPADWHDLLLEHAGNATVSADASDAVATATNNNTDNDTADLASLSLGLFMAELMRSRVSAAIVMHFYSVLLYHVFLVVAHTCFGAIRSAEIQHTKETMIHFILMRCLLLASTMGANQKTKLGLLLVWLSAVAFLRGILAISSARFEHLNDLYRVAFALAAVMVFDVVVAVACTAATRRLAHLVVHFASFEASLLLLETLQLATHVAFHVVDNRANRVEQHEFWLLVLQTIWSAGYVTQLVIYYLFIIRVDAFRVSFLDFVLLLNVKNATVAVLEHARAAVRYYRNVVALDVHFPDASPTDLEAVADDVCVICLQPMLTNAKKLACGHLFHRFCLRQCLQRAAVGDALTHFDAGVGATGRRIRTASDGHAAANTTLRCPICRKHVHTGKAIDEPTTTTRAAQAAGLPDANDDRNRIEDDAIDDAIDAAAIGDMNDSETEEVIRFSTEFLARWIPFPNFSFEIVRHRHNVATGTASASAGPTLGTTAGAIPAAAVTPEMVQHVSEVFPQYGVDAIYADLTRTRSPERTIERILSGAFDGNVAHALDGMHNELQWSVAALWSNLWRNADNSTTEHIALPALLDSDDAAAQQTRDTVDS